MSYIFNEIVIEITRKCNMKCKHCLRGDAQNIDINMNYVRDFLSNCSYIGILTISGGEPSLNVKGIEDLLILLKELNISVGQFYVVTNGSKSSYAKEFIDVMIELWYYQEEKDIENYGYTLQMSKDNYHNKEHQEETIKRLSALSFFSVKNVISTYIIPEGRGKNLPSYYHSIKMKYKYINLITVSENNIETLLYLNCKGKILTDCNLSFTHQDSLKGWNINRFNKYLETNRNNNYA